MSYKHALSAALQPTQAAQPSPPSFSRHEKSKDEFQDFSAPVGTLDHCHHQRHQHRHQIKLQQWYESTQFSVLTALTITSQHVYHQHCVNCPHSVTLITVSVMITIQIMPVWQINNKSWWWQRCTCLLAYNPRHSVVLNTCRVRYNVPPNTL